MQFRESEVRQRRPADKDGGSADVSAADVAGTSRAEFVGRLARSRFAVVRVTVEELREETHRM